MKAIVAGLIGPVLFSPAAIAQDLTSQYVSAFHAFTVRGQNGRYFIQPEGVFAQVLPTLTGRWTNALTISGNTEFVDTAYMADLCQNGPANISIQVTAPNSFSVTEQPDGN